MSITERMANVIAEMEMDDNSAEQILALHEEFRTTYPGSYRSVMRIKPFNRLYVAIVECAFSSLRREDVRF
mgnify:FL=1